MISNALFARIVFLIDIQLRYLFSGWFSTRSGFTNQIRNEKSGATGLLPSSTLLYLKELTLHATIACLAYEMFYFMNGKAERFRRFTRVLSRRGVLHAIFALFGPLAHGEGTGRLGLRPGISANPQDRLCGLYIARFS